MTNKLPSFFNDESNTDKFESLIDFFISWTLRCAEESYNEENTNSVHKHAKSILSILLFGEKNVLSNSIIKSVKTWKQISYIDVLAEVEIETNGELKKHVIVIENKMYSGIRESQLENYKNYAENKYDSEWNKRYLLICADDCNSGVYAEKCNPLGYTVFSIDQLGGLLNKEFTNNALFDEFWFNW